MHDRNEQDRRTDTPATTPTSDAATETPAATRLRAITAGFADQGMSQQDAYQMAREQHSELAEEADREAEQRRQERERRAEQEHREKLESVDWPKKAGRFAGCRLSTFTIHGSNEEQAAQRRVISELETLKLGKTIADGQNVVFVGPCGTGKDHLMHALAFRSFVPLNGRVEIRNGAALRRELRDAAMADEGERSVINRLISTKLLCLSDPVPAGGTELTDFQADALYHIVNERWNARRPIWCTVNLPLEQTREAAERILTAPVWDRLKDGAVIVRCNWRSFRKHSAVIE
ncbi:MAG: ATP-binding protein [Planctomycetota bacterium]|nr:MAG: ATP-binding protein [Planctomycetota bacterium]REK30655.1 MAG: ATP-binding protein [Planctomycetota bacterium]REK33029.1 MAG: ATP-binding protein [Planctomycetota bacterium]